MKAGSNEEGRDEEMEPDVLIAADRAEGDEAPIHRNRIQRKSICAGYNPETEERRFRGDEPLGRLVLLTRRRGLLLVVMFSGAAAKQIRRNVANGHQLVGELVKREDAAADEEHGREQ